MSNRRIVHIPPNEYVSWDDTDTYMVMEWDTGKGYPFPDYEMARLSLDIAEDASLEAYDFSGTGSDYEAHKHRPTYEEAA